MEIRRGTGSGTLLATGAWGPKVLQAMLNEYIDSEIGVDGGIGPATLAAVEHTVTKVEASLQAMAPATWPCGA
jgi:lysozyme family protein